MRPWPEGVSAGRSESTGTRKSTELPVIPPNMQIAFFCRLQDFRNLYPHEALKNDTQNMNLTIVDRDLVSFVTLTLLNEVASFGLRGEVFFPVPSVIRANPYLLGYYRLLYGLLQKVFVTVHLDRRNSPDSRWVKATQETVAQLTTRDSESSRAPSLESGFRPGTTDVVRQSNPFRRPHDPLISLEPVGA